MVEHKIDKIKQWPNDLEKYNKLLLKMIKTVLIASSENISVYCIKLGTVTN